MLYPNFTQNRWQRLVDVPDDFFWIFRFFDGGPSVRRAIPLPPHTGTPRQMAQLESCASHPDAIEQKWW